MRIWGNWITARIRAARQEAGFTLVELLTSMTILIVVLGGVLTSLVSASTAQVDLQSRFEAQEESRLALSTFQRDVRCASSISPTSGTVASVTVTFATACQAASGAATWCTIPNGGRFDLWRVPAATCDTSTAGARPWAAGVTTSNIFTPDATVHVGAPVSPKVQLSFAVARGETAYRLTTSVSSRKATRQ
jgi:type II secretory pathway pseudopilin PulG